MHNDRVLYFITGFQVLLWCLFMFHQFSDNPQILTDSSLSHLTVRFQSRFPYYLSILTLARNEALYIAEWLEYHFLVGVDKFWIVDNDSTDNLSFVLSPYLAMGVVNLSYWHGDKQQLYIFTIQS
jgi:hypothetical protein